MDNLGQSGTLNCVAQVRVAENTEPAFAGLDFVTHSNPAMVRLRNPFRVLNHLPLIRRKLEIGQRWQLIPIENGGPAPALEVLRALGTRDLNVRAAISEIHSLCGRETDRKNLEQDLASCYPTGLLELHITDMCDLHCIACHYRSKGDATIPFGQLAATVRRLGPKAITITGGGEPNVYHSEGRKFGDTVVSIHEAVPFVQLGLINNNTRIPEGNWPELMGWQRSSIDAATQATYAILKRRDLYDTAVGNVHRLLHETGIEDVGVGFLYRPENVHELYLFMDYWYGWASAQGADVQRRFNMQFRPISPSIEQVTALRKGATFPDNDTLETLRQQLTIVRERMGRDAAFEAFVQMHTNFLASFGPEGAPCDTSLFLHKPRFFENCFNAFCHRVFRATGEEYPDFLLCNEPTLSMGNVLHGCSPDEEILRVALMQFYYYNKLGPYCRPEECRQGWVSNTIERHADDRRAIEYGAQGPHNFFF